MSLTNAQKVAVLFSPRLPDYYVTKTGNDTTGDGSISKPWLTVDKALNTIPLAGGKTVGVGTGVYAENTGGTLHVLYVNRAFVNPVTVRPLGDGAVTLTDHGTAFNQVLLIGGAKNLWFQDISFTPTASLSGGTIQFLTGPVSGLRFINCVVNAWGGMGVNAQGLNITISDTQFIGCTFKNATGNSSVNQRNILISAGATGNLALTFISCNSIGSDTNSASVEASLANVAGVVTLNISGGSYSNTNDGSGAGYAILAHGVTVAISGATVTCLTSPPLVLGQDGVGTYATTGTISNCTIIGGTSHGLLMGGLSNVMVSNCTVTGGDYALVMKETTAGTVTSCTVSGASAAAIYYKAATSTTVTGCTISAAAGVAVWLTNNDANSNKKCQSVGLDHCTITVTGSANIFDWGDSTDDAGGGVCDYNTYGDQSSGNFGSVRADASVADLTELIAAWSGYDVANNDTHSTSV